MNRLCSYTSAIVLMHGTGDEMLWEKIPGPSCSKLGIDDGEEFLTIFLAHVVFVGTCIIFLAHTFVKF